jgi:hypothetical protein
MYQFPSPSDSYNPTQTLGEANRVRAKLNAEKVRNDGRFGGAVTKMFGKNRGDNILADATGSAQSTLDNASDMMGIIDFAGGMGRIGASDGGFSGYFDQWKGWGNTGKTIGVDRASAGMGIPRSVAPKTGNPYYGPGY